MYDWSINPRVIYAARQIRRGGVVAYPTEAVWGLGCDPFNQEAVERILELKRRPIEKGVILLAATMDMFAPLLEGLDDLQRQRLKNTWPGPHTWLVPHHGLVPPWISGQFSSVALRVTNHPVAAALSRAYGGAIVSTSCNPAGEPPARDIYHVHRYFRGELEAITNGTVGANANPSEIRDLITGQLIRPS